MGEKSHPQDLCFIRSQQSSGENTRAEFLRKSLLPLDQDLVLQWQHIPYSTFCPRTDVSPLFPAAFPCLVQPGLALSLPIPSGQHHHSAVRRCR